MLKKSCNYIPPCRHFLVALNKAFLQPHLDYTDIIYDKPNNTNIFNKIESLQYSAVLTITEVIRGSYKEMLHQKLSFEYLTSSRWSRKLCLFYKIVVNRSPSYLYNYVSTVNQSYQTRSGGKFPHMYWRTEYFPNSFFRCIVKERNNLSPVIR